MTLATGGLVSSNKDPEKTFGADLRISGLGLYTSDEGAAQATRKVVLGRLETDNIEGQVAGLHYRAGEVSVDGLQTTLGRTQVTAEAADLVDLSAHTDAGDLSVSVGRISFPRGLMFTSHEELFAPHASIDEARIVIDDLGTLFARREAGPAKQAKQAGTGDDQAGDADKDKDKDKDKDRDEGEGEEGGLDWHFLDVFDGQLNIDLAVDMTLPWIGRRRVTHYFRVPIENGTIDYEKLDHDVHWLEASFLQIDLVGDTLVLARDLPLVPYSGKALLRWPLEPEDVPVAKLHRVHLRNLLRWEVPGPDKKDKKEKSKLTLHALAMKNMEVRLQAKAPAQVELPSGALIRFGDEGQSGVVGLDVKGELRYQAAGEPEHTALSGAIELLDITVKDFPLGTASVSVDRLHIGQIDHIEVGFDGFRPHRLELVVSRIAATNLRVQLP
jgi:hypothetical protein